MHPDARFCRISIRSVALRWHTSVSSATRLSHPTPLRACPSPSPAFPLDRSIQASLCKSAHDQVCNLRLSVQIPGHSKFVAGSIDQSIAMVEGYPHGVGGWGLGGVFKEGGRLQVRYFSLLAPFIFAFVLPTAILQLLEVLGLAWWVAGQSPFLPPGPHHPHPILAPPPLPPTPSLRDYLILLAVSVVMWLLASLAVASVCKVVQYIYSDHEEDPSVISSIFKSLPGAIFRLLVTSVWVLLLTILTVFTVSLPFILLGLIFKHATILPILQQVFVSLAVAILGFLFLLSQEVAVLEPENYGLKALKRSAKLVEEKLLVALVLFILSFLVGGLLSNGSSWVASKLANGKLPPWTVYILAVVFALLYLLFLVYVLLVTVVLYFSSKVKYDGEESSLPIDNSYNVVPAEE